MCPAFGVSLQELAIGAASRSTVARFLIDARRRDGVMTQCVGRLGLKQLPMPVDVPTSRLLALSYRLVDGSQTIQAVEARALLASSPSTSSGRTGLSEICRQSGKAKRPKAAPRHGPSDKVEPLPTIALPPILAEARTRWDGGRIGSLQARRGAGLATPYSRFERLTSRMPPALPGDGYQGSRPWLQQAATRDSCSSSLVIF